MVAFRVEHRDRLAHHRPELRPEDSADVQPRLLEVTITLLASRRVSGITGADREAGAAGRNLRHDVRLVWVPGGVRLSPVTENGERERFGGADRKLRDELG
jgi:hypothetical protein